MERNLTNTNENAKLILSKTKSLLNLTSSLLSKNEFQLVPFFSKDHTKSSNFVYRSVNENFIISNSDDDTIKLWNIKIGEFVNTLDIPMEVISSWTITPDEKVIILGTEEGIVKLYDINTGKIISTINIEDCSIYSLEITSTGKYLIIESWNERDHDEYQELTIWDIESDEYVESIRDLWSSGFGIRATTFNEQYFVYNVSYHDSENYYIEYISTLDTQRWKFTDVLKESWHEHSNEVTSLALTLDGKILVSGGGNKEKKICIWDGNEYETYTEISDDEKTIKLWDIESSRYIKVLSGHTDEIIALTITSDGKKIISGSRDKTIKIWDMQSGECINTLEGHLDSVNFIMVSQNGTNIISNSKDNTAKLWDIKTGKCIISTYYTKDSLPITVIENGDHNINEENIDMNVRVNDTPISCRKLTKAEIEYFCKIKDDNKSIILDEEDEEQIEIPF